MLSQAELLGESGGAAASADPAAALGPVSAAMAAAQARQQTRAWQEYASGAPAYNWRAQRDPCCVPGTPSSSSSSSAHVRRVACPPTPGTPTEATAAWQQAEHSPLGGGSLGQPDLFVQFLGLLARAPFQRNGGRAGRADGRSGGADGGGGGAEERVEAREEGAGAEEADGGQGGEEELAYVPFDVDALPPPRTPRRATEAEDAEPLAAEVEVPRPVRSEEVEEAVVTDQEQQPPPEEQAAATHGGRQAAPFAAAERPEAAPQATQPRAAVAADVATGEGGGRGGGGGDGGGGGGGGGGTAAAPARLHSARRRPPTNAVIEAPPPPPPPPQQPQPHASSLRHSAVPPAILPSETATRPGGSVGVASQRGSVGPESGGADRGRATEIAGWLGALTRPKQGGGSARPYGRRETGHTRTYTTRTTPQTTTQTATPSLHNDRRWRGDRGTLRWRSAQREKNTRI